MSFAIVVNTFCALGVHPMASPNLNIAVKTVKCTDVLRLAPKATSLLLDVIGRYGALRKKLLGAVSRKA